MGPRGSKPAPPSRASRLAALVLAAAAAACAALPAPLPVGRVLPESLDGLVLAEHRELSDLEFYGGLAREEAQLFALDLRKVEIGEYQDSPGGRPSLRALVYSLGTNLDAFGFYVALRRKAGAAAPGPAFPYSYGTGEERALYKGNWVVRLLKRSEAVPSGTLDRLAAEIAGGLPGLSSLAVADALVESGIPPADIGYEPVSVLGTGLLAPALSAALSFAPEGRTRLHLTVKPSEDSSIASLQNLLMARAGGPKGVAFTIGVGDVACYFRDDAYGWVDISRQGRYIVSVAGLKDPDQGWPIISRVIAAISR